MGDALLYLGELLLGLEYEVSDEYFIEKMRGLTFCRREPDERADPAEVLCMTSEFSVAMVPLLDDDLAVLLL